jgi:pyruvate dehydrogenase E1 component beta subunit
MDAPIQHVTGVDVPMPYAKNLERASLPARNDVLKAVRAIVPQKVRAG